MAPAYRLRDGVDRLVTAGIVLAGNDTVGLDAEEAARHDELVRAESSGGSDSDGDGDGGGS